MTLSFTGRKRLRKFFGKIVEVAEMPNLIEVQKTSYDQFLQVDKPEGGRRDEGLQAVFSSVFPIKDFSRILAARICRLSFRGAQIRRRGMPAALHDLCGAAQGDAAADRVRCRPGNRRQIGQGHQGTGRLYGRHPVHDRERHLHRQRHRARDRFPDAPHPGRLLRSRQGQDPFQRQAAVRRPRHSLSRLVARLRIRRQGHRPCPHRPPPQAAGDDAALCAGPRPGSRSSIISTRKIAFKRAKDGGWTTPVEPVLDAQRQGQLRLEERQDRRCARGSRPPRSRCAACARWQEEGDQGHRRSR